MPEDVHISSGLVIAILVVLWGLFWTARKAWPGVVALVDFIRSWNGYTKPDGTRVPGVLEKLEDLGEAARAAAEAAGAAESKAEQALQELQPNSGESLWDKVKEMADGQQAMAAEVTQLRGSLEQHIKDSSRAPRRDDGTPEADFSQITHG